MSRMIDADELKRRMCDLCNSDYSDEPCDPSDCVFIRAINETPTLTQPNEPLTLDELGEMSYTDWVWLEFPREKPSDNCWERGWKAYRLYSHERYGVSWIAYRRPPEEEI